MHIQEMRITVVYWLGMSGLLLGFTQLAQEKQVMTLEFHSLTTFVSIWQKKNQWLDVRTQQNYEHFHFVQDCQLDGKEKQSISHQELLNAKTLDFTLSWLPKH